MCSRSVGVVDFFDELAAQFLLNQRGTGERALIQVIVGCVLRIGFLGLPRRGHVHR